MISPERPLSAPSVTSTRPDRGTAASSCRARSSARGKMGLAAFEREVGRALQPIRRLREAEQPQLEARGEALQQGPVLAERLASRTRSRGVPAVGDAHAARVVEEHADEALLRHRGREHEPRPAQAEGDHGQGGRPGHGQDHAVGAPGRSARPRVAPDGGRHPGQQDDRRRPGRADDEPPLLEDERAVLEEQLEDGLEVEGPSLRRRA